MAKQVKTKEIAREIKEHTVDSVKDKVTAAGIRTKDKAVEKVEDGFQPLINGQNNKKEGSAENYAADTVTENAQIAAETTAEYGTRAVKRGINKAKKKAEKTQKADDADSSKQNSGKKAREEETKSTESTAKRTAEQRKNAEIKQMQKSSPRTAQNKAKTVDELSEKPRRKEKAVPKTRGKQDVKNVKPTDNKIKTLNGNAHKIKETKNSGAKARRSIKTAENSFKTAEKNAKAAKKSAEATAKEAKKAEESAKVVIKSTVKAAQTTAKAIVEGTKAAVVAGKEIVAAVVAGGPVVIVIVVICLLAAVGGTCFGIFLSNDKTTGSQMQMSQAISQLTSEYYNDLTVMKLQYTYDTIEVLGDTSLNWKDVLAIYAVKYTNNADGFDVATLDDKKLGYLKKQMKEMNPCTGIVTVKLKPVVKVVTDGRENQTKTTTYENQKVLTITALHVSAKKQAEIEKFNDEQKKQLNELLSSDYDALWSEIIGSTGEILTPGGSYVGTNIFAWPLSVQGTITSRFGTRVDPITGVVKTHGGTDIAAATGTPILAAADGTVEYAGYNEGGYGFYVKIRHNATYETIYGHCSVLHVSTGQTVQQGQMIAEVGSTGHSTGPHLHYEVIQNGVRVNALLFYKAS